MLSTCQDSGPGVTALVQILFLGHCIQVQKSVFLALYRARKITLSFSFPQTMWKLILVHLRGRKHFCIWVEKCFPPLRCTPTSVFYMVWGKKEYKVIFLALYNARKTTFCTWVWCLLSKWWVRKNIFPISYILQKVLRCRKCYIFIKVCSCFPVESRNMNTHKCVLIRNKSVVLGGATHIDIVLAAIQSPWYIRGRVTLTWQLWTLSQFRSVN